MKMHMGFFGCAILLTGLLPQFGCADQNTYSVSGKVFFNEDAPIYIILVDEETAKIPFTGIRKSLVIPNAYEMKSGYTEFFFTDIQRGIYGIRCYQDLNKNGKLDRGIFGPTEPWGLSWDKKGTMKPPKFSEFSFLLESDKTDLRIDLRK